VVAAANVNTVVIATVSSAADLRQWRELQSLMWGDSMLLPPAAGCCGGILIATLERLEGYTLTISVKSASTCLGGCSLLIRRIGAG